MIEFQNVHKRYGGTSVLDDLSLTLEAGQFIVLIGPSGCGKTTTLKCINRLIQPEAGQILIQGQDITGMNPAKLRRTIGYVIQQIGLFPNMTVAQNISVVPRLLGYSRERREQIVREMLELVGMPYEENAGKYPSELSGGQQQRIGVLRALAASPPIVLMDEPFSALDPLTRESLQEEIKRIQRKLNKTIVFVTHDMGEALLLADTIVFMEGGRVVQQASPEEMLKHPASDTVRSFMGKHLGENGAAGMTAADFMKPRPLKVPESHKVISCVDLMRRHEVNTVLVTDDGGRFLGVVSIEDIRDRGKSAASIGALLTPDSAVTVGRGENARAAFSRLLDCGQNFLVVLNDDRTVAGLITRTSTVRAIGDALWGDEL